MQLTRLPFICNLACARAEAFGFGRAFASTAQPCSHAHARELRWHGCQRGGGICATFAHAPMCALAVSGAHACLCWHTPRTPSQHAACVFHAMHGAVRRLCLPVCEHACANDFSKHTCTCGRAPLSYLQLSGYMRAARVHCPTILWLNEQVVRAPFNVTSRPARLEPNVVYRSVYHVPAAPAGAHTHTHTHIPTRREIRSREPESTRAALEKRAIADGASIHRVACRACALTRTPAIAKRRMSRVSKAAASVRASTISYDAAHDGRLRTIIHIVASHDINLDNRQNRTSTTDDTITYN